MRLNMALKAKLIAIARSQDRTLSYVIDKALSEYVMRVEQQPKTKK